MRHFDELDKRLDYIEFRQELLFENTDLTRLLFEYEIDRKQYKKIMDLMEAYRKKLDNKESVNHGTFETEMFRIVPECHEDYHMCEYIARAFMDEHRWEEVFPALYGDMPKYKFLKSENGRMVNGFFWLLSIQNILELDWVGCGSIWNCGFSDNDLADYAS